MNIPTLTCVMLVLACTVRPMPLSAQTIYRCGNAYSEAPCPGGVAIDVNDRRSAAQKAQTDAAARQAAASALHGTVWACDMPMRRALMGDIAGPGRPLTAFYCAGRRMHFGEDTALELAQLASSCQASCGQDFGPLPPSLDPAV